MTLSSGAFPVPREPICKLSRKALCASLLLPPSRVPVHGAAPQPSFLVEGRPAALLGSPVLSEEIQPCLADFCSPLPSPLHSPLPLATLTLVTFQSITTPRTIFAYAALFSGCPSLFVCLENSCSFPWSQPKCPLFIHSSTAFYCMGIRQF